MNKQIRNGADKSYSAEEETERVDAFVKNTIRIEEHNKKHARGEKSFEIGMNHLADLVGSLWPALGDQSHHRNTVQWRLYWFRY